MQIVTVELLQRIGVSPSIAKIWQDPLSRAANRYQINTPTRLEDWLGQLIVESKHLTKTREDLYYITPTLLVKNWPSRFTMSRTIDTGKRYAPDYVRNPQKLANAVYSGRMGNGNEASGDGWRFSGGGIGMLTGRGMWTAYKKHSGHDVITHPDLFDDPYISADAAAWVFAVDKNLLDEADADLVTLIRQRYNGGHIGLKETREATRRIRDYFMEIGIGLNEVLTYQSADQTRIASSKPNNVLVVAQPQLSDSEKPATPTSMFQSETPTGLFQQAHIQGALTSGENDLVKLAREIIAIESESKKTEIMKGKPWWWSKLVGIGVTMMVTAITGYFSEKGFNIDKDVLINILWLAIFIFGSLVTIIRAFFTKTILTWRKSLESTKLR